MLRHTNVHLSISLGVEMTEILHQCTRSAKAQEKYNGRSCTVFLYIFMVYFYCLELFKQAALGSLGNVFLLVGEKSVFAQWQFLAAATHPLNESLRIVFLACTG